MHYSIFGHHLAFLVQDKWKRIGMVLYYIKLTYIYRGLCTKSWQISFPYTYRGVQNKLFLEFYPTTTGFQWGHLKNGPYTLTVSGGPAGTFNFRCQINQKDIETHKNIPALVQKALKCFSTSVIFRWALKYPYVFQHFFNIESTSKCPLREILGYWKLTHICFTSSNLTQVHSSTMR